jgi:hypothetical protein
MKHYFCSVITQYDGYEWVSYSVTRAHSQEIAERKTNKINWTHENGIEVQEPAWCREINKEDYQVLKKYL